MTDSTFEECFDWLENYHGRKLPPAARRHYREEFQDVPDELFADAIKAAARENAPGKFPSIAVIESFIDEERERLEQRRYKEKTTEPDREQAKVFLRRLLDEVDRLDAEKEQREAEKRSRERDERRIAREQFLDEQAKFVEAQTSKAVTDPEQKENGGDPKWIIH
jgi:hypothetical protein